MPREARCRPRKPVLGASRRGGPGRRRGLLAAILACLGLFGALPPAAEAQADRSEVVELRFEGNRSFSDQALANAIVTRRSECRSVALAPFCWMEADWAREMNFLSPRSFERDVVRLELFYYQRGFREAQVDTALSRPSPAEVRITFRIDEGRPVRVDSLEVTGLEGVADGASLARDLPVEVGDPLSSVQLDATRDTLRRRLRNRGHARAEVLQRYFIPSDRPYTSSVTFEAHPGPTARIGPITVVGTREVSDAVVERMLSFEEGDLYRQNLVLDAQRNLYNLEIFRHAEIREDLEHVPDTVVPLRVQVNEGDVHRVRTGAGWDNADCFSAESRWISRNYFGGARRLQVRARLSNVLAPSLHRTVCNESGSGEFGRLNWLLSTDFNQPWLFSPRNSFAARLYGERQSLKDIFVRTGVGASLSLTRSVGRRQNLTLGYAPQLSTLDAAEIFFCTSFLVCQPDDIDALASSNWLSPVVLSYSRDRSDRVLDPTRGYTLQVDLEHASDLTGSNFAYNRLVAEANWYLQLDSRWVAAARIRGGWLDPRPFGGNVGPADELQIAHPQKRFFGGGSNSVRGYAQNQLGPRNLSVPVDVLLGTGGDAGEVCSPREVLDLSCDAGWLDDARFTPRPTGGSRVLEGNLELRFPGPGTRAEGAVFMDLGQVWADPGEMTFDDLRFTPGVGIRYLTPVGPVRLDVAYQLEAGERLQVVTTQIRPFDPDRDDETDRLRGPEPDREPLDFVRTEQLALLQPRVLFGDHDAWSASRFQIHVSIGQAF